MAQRPADSGFEDIAVRLLRHLEWQSGFSIVFLFVEDGQAERLRLWLNQRLDFAGRPIHRVSPVEFPGEPGVFVERLLTLPPGLPVDVPVWVEAFEHSSDLVWNDARRVFLARLNERRFLLERDFGHALVVLLPLGFRQEARNIAPDIWHVRAFSDDLAAPRLPEVPAGGASESGSKSAGLSRLPERAVRAEREWERVRHHVPERINLALGWSAVDALCTEEGALHDAGTAAAEVLAAARARLANVPDEPGRLRDLSVSLNKVGQVAWARGALAEAEGAYRESLGLSRQLAERLGDTPEALRDLSVSLDNLGQVAWARGALAEAEGAYRESLGLRRQLAERRPDLPGPQDDLGCSLILLGQVEAHRGELGLLREAEAVLGALVRCFGDNSGYRTHWEQSRAALSAANSVPPEEGTSPA